MEFEQKLDKKFQGTITKVKNGQVVPDDEYVVFLAKDNAFAACLPGYLLHCKMMQADAEQIKAVETMIANVVRWRAAHPEQCKVPDAVGDKLLD